MAIRITPMRPIERNGLKGFGLSVFIDNSNPVAKASEDNGRISAAMCAPMAGEVSRAHGPDHAGGTPPPIRRDSVERHAPLSHSSRPSSPETKQAGEVPHPASPATHPEAGK